LLPNKQEETYTRVIHLIQEMWPTFQPAKISLDFEMAVINAFSNDLPGVCSTWLRI
jgi:hypothetical protein